MDLSADDVIAEVGEFGLYQKLCLYFILLPVCVLSGIQFQKQIIMTSTPDHWCRPSPELVLPDDMPEDVVKRLLPLETTGDGMTRYSRCSAFVLSDDVIAVHKLYGANGSHDNPADALYNHETMLDALLSGKPLSARSPQVTETCQHGWQYDQTHFTSTIVSQWDLVCDRSVLAAVSLSLFLLGGVIGVILSGYMADRWGRKMALLASLSLSSVADFVSYFCSNFALWLVFRTLAGMAVPSIYQLSFILAIEMVGADHRNFVTVAIYFFFSLGLVLVCGIMYLLRDWSTLTLATAIPGLLTIIAVKFAPESPRWLIAQGNLKNTMNTLNAMCKVNGTILSEGLVDRLKQKDELRRTVLINHTKPAAGSSFMSLFRTPNMRKKTIIVVVVWLINMTVYSGLSIFAPALGSSPYMSLFLSSVIELPSHGILLWVMEWWSRRCSMAVLLFLGGICCMATVLLPPDDTTVHLVLFLVGKFSLSATFLILYAFGGELFPTEVRGKGLALSSYIGMLGGCLSPYIDLLGVNNFTLPLTIMGLASVVGGFLCLLLPETLHQRLPETLEEGEKFGKLSQWKTFFVCLPKIDQESPANEQGPRGSRRLSRAPNLLLPMLNVTTLSSDPMFANTRYTSSPHIRDIMVAAQLQSVTSSKPK